MPDAIKALEESVNQFFADSGITNEGLSIASLYDGWWLSELLTKGFLKMGFSSFRRRGLEIFKCTVCNQKLFPDQLRCAKDVEFIVSFHDQAIHKEKGQPIDLQEIKISLIPPVRPVRIRMRPAESSSSK